MNSVHEQYPNSDLNSAQNSALHQAACPMSRPQRMSRHHFLPLTEQARSRPQMMSRPQVQQARSRRQSHVATSWTTKPMSRPPGRPSPCRDIKFMSRPQFPTSQVATSVPCRDLLETNLCRDIVPMSRRPTLSPMSRRQLQLSPISATSRRHVATSLATTHVATSK